MKIQYFKQLFILSVVTLIATSCQPSGKKEGVHEQQKVVSPVAADPEDAAVELVMDLEEVKHKDAQVRKGSKGNRHLVGYVETPPAKNDPYYWVKVAEDNGGSFVTYYTFAVHSKTRNIKYYDVVQDSLVSIEQWRESTPLSER